MFFLGPNHWCKWFFDWLNVFWLSDHSHQWFFNGFPFFYHCFQWFSMVPYHWSNDAMVSMDRCGLVQAHTVDVEELMNLSTFDLEGALVIPLDLDPLTS